MAASVGNLGYKQKAKGNLYFRHAASTSKLMTMTLLATVFFSSTCIGSSVNSAPVLESPKDGSSTTMRNPHLTWEPVCPISATQLTPACSGYIIQIAGDVEFKKLHVADARVPTILTRFVVMDPLPPSTYFWRVGVAGDTTSPTWALPNKLTIVNPNTTITVSCTASFGDIQQAFNEASRASSTLVQFDPCPGVRRLEPGNQTVFVALENCTDVVVDFAGANFVFDSLIR